MVVNTIKVSVASSLAEISLHCTAEILRWNDQTETWTEVGLIETGRFFHAMVAVTVTADADTFCTTQ